MRISPFCTIKYSLNKVEVEVEVEANINRSMQHRLELLKRVRTGPGKSWILLSHFPGVGSLGTRLLVLESSGNMLNSRQTVRRINIEILDVKGLIMNLRARSFGNIPE